ncbi:MAG: efflux RND transporter permease subunit [Planctomycetes bacterium]|nr:efflux RND transporter permease subunit [Planctomycetota bacterium]
MQKLVDVCIRRPVFASMLIAALVVVGIASYVRLGVDRFPTVDLPTVSVRTTVPGASTEEVETLVSQRIEEAVNTVEGIEQLRSISTNGSSVVLLTFDLSREIDGAAQDVRDRVATVLRQLPPEAEAPIIGKFDNDQTPVLSFALSADRPLRELTELADKVVKPQIERSTGVGGVTLVGASPRAINVWIDADRLRAYGLPITTVRDALRRQNAETPGGNVTGPERESVLRTMGRLAEPRDFEELVVATIDGVPIRVRDLGRAEDGTKEIRSLSRLDGNPCVLLEVRRQSGANTIEVIDGVKEKLARATAELPADVRVDLIRDQSRYIHAALDEIRLHLVLGSVLASLVVLIFMRSWRSTIIASVAIPCSVIASFGVMEALGFTLNSVTMLALVLMVGIVIDDAIVVLENIFRFLEEKRMKPFDAAREGTAEIALAVTATTLSLAVIFVPVSFMSSISGRFLYQFGITAAAAVMVSLLVSFTLTPMMSARLLRVADAHGAAPRSRGGFYAWIERGYGWMLRGSLRFRPLVLLLALAVIASSKPLYEGVKQEYTPSDVDEAEFDINVTAPEGTSLDAMDEVMKRVERELLAVPGVRLVQTSVGGSFLGQVNSGSAYVRIAPHEERTLSVGRLWSALLDGDPSKAWRDNYSQRDVMVAARKRLSQFKDLRCSVRNAPSFNIGGGPFEIDFSILGPELEQLAKYGEALRIKAGELGGIADADTTLKLEKPELQAVVDRDRAANLGVDVADVATALRLMVGGEERVSRFRDRALGEEYDVQLRLEERDRADPGRIAELWVPSQNGGLARIDNLVELRPAISASRIDRLDRQRVVSVRASVGPGYALADRLQALRGAVAEMNLPAVYTTRVLGRGRELERTFQEFLWAFLLSVVLMYIILAAQFESLVHPLTILFSLPLSVPFALWSLDYSENSLNLYSALGILVLFGVVKKNAILQIDHTNQLRERGLERRDAILQANRDRLRPILMTTFALVAGMLPLWLGSGPGSEERRAVAVVVIGGQTLSLLLTLLVTPVVYSYFDDLGRLFRGRRSTDAARDAAAASAPVASAIEADDDELGRASPS